MEGKNAELAAADRLTAAIIENIDDPFVVLDNSLKIVRWNQQFQDAFWDGDGDLVHGTPFRSVLLDRKLDESVRQSQETGQALRKVEFSFTGGEKRDERHFLVTISLATERQELVLAIFHDITEWRRRQLQVMEASHLVAVGEMAAGVAHEINNPLGAIVGLSQLVLRNSLEPMVRRDLENILEQAKRAANVVVDLGSFARSDRLDVEPLDVVRVLQKTLESTSSDLSLSNVQVKTSLNPRVPQIMADKHQIERVFRNIIINARQSMAGAHDGGTLKVKVRDRDDMVRVSFADDGPGISSDDLPKIFDPFFTTREVGQGTGLGLSMCYGVVREHGGSIWAESTRGQGATIIVELPVARSQPSESVEAPGANAEVAAEPMRVLVADDEPSVANFIERCLRQEGHAVDVASNGRELMRLVDLTVYQLILLDMKMPDVGGAEVFEHLRELPGDIASRVVFITGDCAAPATMQFIDRSGNMVLAKPFTLEDLLSVVRRFAAGRGG